MYSIWAGVHRNQQPTSLSKAAEQQQQQGTPVWIKGQPAACNLIAHGPSTCITGLAYIVGKHFGQTALGRMPVVNHWHEESRSTLNTSYASDRKASMRARPAAGGLGHVH